MMKRHFRKERMYGWHFRKGDGLSYRDPRTPKVGETLQALTLSGRLVRTPYLCAPGFHAFPDIRSCLFYSHCGRRLSFVLLEDVIGRKGQNKVSAKYRTILWQADVPSDVDTNSHTALQAWLKKAGFKRASATAKARVLRAKRKK